MNSRSNSPPPDALGRACDAIAHAAVLIAGASMVGLVLVQGWQVLARYLLNDSPSWSEPLTIVLLSTAMSLAAAAAVHGEQHFAFTLLRQRAGVRLQRGLLALSHAVVVALGLAVAYGAARLFLDGLDVRMAGAPLPQSAALAPLALGAALIALFGLRHLWRTLTGLPSAEAR